MNDTIFCLVPSCQHRTIAERKRPLGRRPGSNVIVIHHECEDHKFHQLFGGSKPWEPCDCPRDA
jgi:hypothetical protein